MPRPLRGHHLELEIPSDPAELVAAIEQLGFTANSYIDEVARRALTFAAQEDERMSKILALKTVLLDPVVCRYYCDVRGQPSWLILRRMEDRWILSAMVTETLAERG